MMSAVESLSEAEISAPFQDRIRDVQAFGSLVLPRVDLAGLVPAKSAAQKAADHGIMR